MPVKTVNEFLAAYQEKDVSAEAFELENQYMLEVRLNGLPKASLVDGWWTGETGVQIQAWTRAGFKAAPRLKFESVVFTRSTGCQLHQTSIVEDRPPAQLPTSSGAMDPDTASAPDKSRRGWA